MNTNDLKSKIALHLLWIVGDKKGERANLSGANLSRADLSGADLYGANLSKTILEGKAILSFQFEKHTAYFYGTENVTIGCHTHTIKYWLKNYKQIGIQEKYSPKQIKMYLSFVKQCSKILK